MLVLITCTSPMSEVTGDETVTVSHMSPHRSLYLIAGCQVSLDILTVFVGFGAFEVFFKELPDSQTL